MGLTDIFIKRPVLSIVVSLLILLIGLRAFMALPVRQYPRLENTIITVTTAYPGSSPDSIQGFITTPIEQAVASAEGIDYLTSSSQQGQSTISAYIKLNYDANKALTEVSAKVNQVKFRLPREANDPVIVKQTGQTTAVMYMGFASPNLSSPAISDFLNRVIQPQLATLDGVGSVDILGGQTFAMRLWVDPVRMAAHGVTATDLSNAILTNNFQSAPGQSKGYFTITNIGAETGLTSVEEFRDLVVKAKDDALVRIKDIGTVELGAQSNRSSVSMNGDHAIFIAINATPNGNPLDIVKGVRAMMPELTRSLPPSVRMDIVYDTTRFIQASIDEVIQTLVEAVGIVIVVVFLFLGTFRAVIIPIVTIPLSIVGSMTLMLALGFSINLLTLLAMVLAIGLVVDDAIVVVENVYRWIEKGKTPIQAAIIGSREIVGPVIAMTITLAAVYAPIGFQTGLTGTLFREFAFTLAGSVVISGIVALTLSPMMCSALLTKEMSNGWFARIVDATLSAITRWYERRLVSSLDYRPVTALFAIGILAVTALAFIGARDELAPPEDQGIIFSVTKAPQYANLDYIDQFGDKVDKVFRSFGETDTTFVINGSASQTQGFAGMITKPWDQRKATTEQLIPQVSRKLVTDVEGLQVFAFNLPPLPGSSGGLPVQMVVSSPGDYRTLFGKMEEIKAKARKSGKFLVVDSDLAFNQPFVDLKIDRSKANNLGVTMQSIGNTLAILVGENYINRFNLNGRSYDVIPQVPRSDRLSAEKLTEFYVNTASGGQVPLSTVVSVVPSTQPNALTKYNQLNAATFSAVPFPGVPMGEAVAFLNQTADEVLPKDFHRDFLSESRQYVQEGNQLNITLGFALIIIFLVLAAQFESLRDPFVILVTVPLAMCGALMPLFIGAATLNIYTKVGLVTLVGLISKHGILMVEFANELQVHEGLSKRRAIERSATVRLRPILMTTAAMVAGLVPLLSATGAGAASRFSIGIVIVTGMSVGTLFTLFVLPAVYTVLATDHAKVAKGKRVREIAELDPMSPANSGHLGQVAAE